MQRQSVPFQDSQEVRDQHVIQTNPHADHTWSLPNQQTSYQLL